MLKKINNNKNEENNNKKSKILEKLNIEKVNQILCITMFLIIMIAFVIFTFGRKKRDVLYYENRLVSPMPKFELGTLLDGGYMQGFEEHFKDILAFRNGFIKMNVIYEKYLMNKSMINDAIIAKNDLLLYHTYDELFERFSDENCDKALARVEKLATKLKEENIPFYYVGIPQKMSYCAYKYPKYYFSGEELFDKINKNFGNGLEKMGVNFINIQEYYKSLNLTEDEKNKMYYHVDHHYTFIAAYRVYEKLMNTLNSDSKVLSKIKNNKSLNKKLFMYDRKDIDFKYLPNPFVGSLGKKAANMFDKGDKLIVPIKKDVPYERYDNGYKSDIPLVVMPSNENVQAGYEIYMGADVANTVIDTNRLELPNVLVYGDSYTNPLELLLYASFNQMHSVDFRHYESKEIMKYIRDNKIDIVICVKDDSSYYNDTGNGAEFIVD